MRASVDARPRRDLQYISLRTAASLAYMRLVGSAPNARDVEVLRRVLDDVAHALAMIAPICNFASGELETIDDRPLVAGRFIRGASALIGPDGREYADLVIQRSHLDSAILILLQTRLTHSLRGAYLKAS